MTSNSRVDLSRNGRGPTAVRDGASPRSSARYAAQELRQHLRQHCLRKDYVYAAADEATAPICSFPPVKAAFCWL